MIQLNELRLGNWVCDSKFSQFPMQVVNLGTDYVYLNFEGNEGDVWEPDIKEMCGLPLTEELLLKCGFMGDHGGFCKNNVYLTYGRSTRGTNLTDFDLYLTYNYWLVSRSKIEYLHQLQNLYFALTGEELKIKL